MAGLALDPHVGHEVHLDAALAVAPAGFAAAAGSVEAEAVGVVAAHLGVGQAREQLADPVERAGVGRRVAGRRAADGRLVDVDDLVQVPDAVDLIVLADAEAGTVQLARQRPPQDVVDQRALAGTGNAGHAGEPPERNRHGDVLEVVLTRAADDEPGQTFRPRGRGLLAPGGCLPCPPPGRLLISPFVNGSAIGGDGDGRRSGEIGAGEGVGDDAIGWRGRLARATAGTGPGRYVCGPGRYIRACRGELGRRALGHDPAAVTPGPRAEVEQSIGAGDYVPIMFHQQQRVTQIAQSRQRLHQALRVARVEADRRLVEHVQHAGEPAANLAGQPDALRLAAGERRRGTMQREVVQAHVDQELQPVANLLEHFAGDFSVALVELQVAKERRALIQRHLTHRDDALARQRGRRTRRFGAACATADQPDGGRFRTQPPAATGHAGDIRDGVAQFVAKRPGVAGRVVDGGEETAPLEAHALERRRAVEPRARRAEHQRAFLLRGPLRQWRVRCDLQAFAQRGQEPAQRRPLLDAVPPGDRAVEQGALRVLDNCGGRSAALHAESLARLAPAELAVEAEVVGSQLFVTRAALRAHEPL